jgi:glycosyltransferase involved in cell wall biosynthesis
MDKMLEKLDNNISQMNYPLISIIICTYNGERFLKEQIQSIVEQTYPNLEIIISDDASTDKTKAILSEYKKIFKHTAGF